MKEISVRKIEDAIASMCGEIAVVYNSGIRNALLAAKEAETTEKASAVMDILIQNAEIAEKERIPICQDTGMAIVFLKIGQDVHLTDGSLNEAVNRGVERGYTDNLLEAYKQYGGSMHLFGAHTVFGQVVEGMDVVDKIAACKTDEDDKPVEDVVIESIEIAEW